LLGWLFGAAAIAWAVALPFATFLASDDSGTGQTMRDWFVLAVYSTGSFICHQRPDRSFRLWAFQMPVCARCTGIYVGSAFAAMAAGLRSAGFRSGSFRPAGFRSAKASRYVNSSPGNIARGFSRAKIALLLSIVPTALTLMYEWTAGITPANWIRAMAGLPIGMVVSAIVMSEIGTAANDEVN
jgi:hypothetical protein